MRQLALIVVSCVLSMVLVGADVHAQTSTLRIASGISRPVFVTAPPGDTSRLFVTEQHTGRIEIIDLDNNNAVLPTPFLDLGGLATGNEQGLLGLAFDPNYADNGFFYVNITTTAGGGDTVIRRYKVSDTDPDVADASSGFTVLTFNQPATNHNGGWIGFSPNDDENLYIASGDGGDGNDCCSPGHTANIGNAQDLTNNLLGKMLRINPSREDEPVVPYTVPETNPFVDVTGDDEIWSYGLRNPYRSSFDRETGDLWIGDVGQGAREEIDFQPAESDGGENYGWRLREGTIATPTNGIGGPRPDGNVEPIYDYTRGGGPLQGNVVIGGYVYRGPVEAFQGHYIFADAGTNNIWSLDPDAINPRDSVMRINDRLIPNAGNGIGGIGSFGEDELGNLYIMEVFGGELFRIVTTSQDIIWDGDAAVGTPGDGISWNDADNWSRGGNVDEAFVEDDHVIFASGSSQPNVDLVADRTVSAVTFGAPFTLQNNTLRVLSGNVTVDDAAVATIESDLVAETADHALRKLGPGTLLVNGNAGQTVVKAGTLGGDGSFDHLTVEGGATLAPGASAGVLTVDQSFTLEEGSTLEIELGGTDNGDQQNPEFDQLLVGGLASLSGGTLEVLLIDSFEPGHTDQFPILSATLGFDNFADADLPDLEPGLEWFVNPGGITLSLNVQIALPGDYNQDGTVDAADYTVWRDSLGQQVVRGSFADGDGDGVIGQGDYDVWRTNFGAMAASSAAFAVPEPSSLALLMVGCLAVGLRREHRR